MPRPAREIPGPRGRPIVGNLSEMRGDPLGLLLRLLHEYGDVSRLRIPGMTIYHAHHPDDIKHVLQDNHQNYRKGRAFDGLRHLVANGLFTAEGELWLRQRRLMQPAFHRSRIAGFGAVMTRLTEEMLDRWEGAARNGEVIDAANQMVHLTMAVITESMFGASVSDETNTITRAIEVCLSDTQYRFERPLYPPPGFPTPHNLRFRRALSVLDHTVFDIIGRRRESGSEGDDLLGMLMAARDEGSGAGMDDRQLRDEVVTMFLAGHETTARALSWIFYLLDQNRDAEARLHAELARVLGGRTPEVSDIPNLPYTRMVIDEALRIYPPVWITNREAIAEDEIGGYRIPAGSSVSITPYATHRHPDFWEDPERFDPKRFTPERSAGRPRFAYLPFGGGPRQCIGNNFALTEAVLVLATISRRYCLRVPPGHRVELLANATLQPAGGLPVRLEPRSV